MKRYGNLYEKIYDLDNLRLAHKNASKQKGWYKEVVEINKNPEKYLIELQTMLKEHTYCTSEYLMFIKNDGNKEREIYKLPYYPDRVCQWAILQVIEPILIKKFVINTYSSIPGRGIHFGLERVKKDLKNKNKNCQYCLKIDVKKFYPSIDKEILKSQLQRIFKDKELLWLLYEIIDSCKNGIPIGNYLSQYFGNLYLSEFDHWIKEVKHIKYYHRYMDDIVIFGSDKNKLKELQIDINNYFINKLHINMKENWQIFPTYIRGVDFLGYRFFGDYVLLRKRVCKKFKKKVLKISKKEYISYSDWCSINSYIGWFKYCNSYRLKKKYLLPILPKMRAYAEENNMKTYLNTKSNVKPKLKEIINDKVFIVKGLTEAKKQDEETKEEYIEYTYDLYELTKDEYIETLETQVTDIQMGLTEVYEMLV